MIQHWNVEVAVQHVIPKQEPIPQPGRAPISGTERRVTEVLRIAVTGQTEADAYRKAIKLLEISQPEPVPVGDDVPATAN